MVLREVVDCKNIVANPRSRWETFFGMQDKNVKSDLYLPCVQKSHFPLTRPAPDLLNRALEKYQPGRNEPIGQRGPGKSISLLSLRQSFPTLVSVGPMVRSESSCKDMSTPVFHSLRHSSVYNNALRQTVKQCTKLNLRIIMEAYLFSEESLNCYMRYD
jgi:hypothetical protein